MWPWSPYSTDGSASRLRTLTFAMATYFGERYQYGWQRLTLSRPSFLSPSDQEQTQGSPTGSSLHLKSPSPQLQVSQRSPQSTSLSPSGSSILWSSSSSQAPLAITHSSLSLIVPGAPAIASSLEQQNDISPSSELQDIFSCTIDFGPTFVSQVQKALIYHTSDTKRRWAPGNS